MKQIVAVSFVFCMIIGCIGCTTVPITQRRQLVLVSSQELLSVSDTMYKDVMAKATLSANTSQKNSVATVGSRIAKSAELFLKENGMEDEIANYAWEFNLVEDPKTINAFCLPGGKIVVYTGILPVAQDADGLATVIGHEVAHAIANHGGERMSQQLMVDLGSSKLSTLLSSKPEKTKNAWMTAYNIGTNVGVLLPYSRSQETEADRIGLIIMARAGFDPRAAVPFWQRMEQAGSSGTPQFLSTHPAPTKRIEALKLLLPEALKYFKE